MHDLELADDLLLLAIERVDIAELLSGVDDVDGDLGRTPSHGVLQGLVHRMQ